MPITFFSSRLRWSLALIVTLLAGSIGFALAKPKPPPVSGEAITVRAETLSRFGRIDRGQTTFGALEWRSGVVLSSEPQAFGGWSAIALDPTGTRLLAISDGAGWMTGKLQYEAGKVTALGDTRIGSLRDRNGKPFEKPSLVDAEALALVKGTLDQGSVYIGFERRHRVAVSDIVKGVIQAPSRLIPLPPEAKAMGNNEGLEALAVLSGGPYKGSLIAFPEAFPDKEGRHTGWLWVKGKAQRLSLSNADDYGVTDCAPLVDGGLLVLERRYRMLEGVRMRLRHIAAGDIKPGARLEGTILLQADQTKEIDNMEGVAVHAGEDGETIITLMSDDNFNRSLQRTLLLQFTWRRGEVAN